MTEQAEAAQPQGGKKNLIVIAAVVLVAIGASIGGTLFFLAPEEVVQESADAAPVTETAEKAIYHNLRPPFIVNFLAGNKPRYLQAEVTVMARDHVVIEAVINHTPLIRSRVVNFFADQDYRDLQTHEGKQALREGIRDAIEGVLAEESETLGIEAVLLTNFVMQ